MIWTPILSDHSDNICTKQKLQKSQIVNPLSNQTSWDTNRTTPFQFQNNLLETTYVNTCNRIKRSSGCYHPRRYRRQRFRIATAGCSCTPRNARLYTCASVWILIETVFERSASVDTIRVSAGVTVTVESKQQTWTKQSLPQRYLCVGCQLSSDHAIRSLCLKGHVRVRGSTLWRHRWQEATEFLCTITSLLGGSWATKKVGPKPQKRFLRRLRMSRFENFAADAVKRKPLFVRFFWNCASRF